jgi:hypothetical protein
MPRSICLGVAAMVWTTAAAMTRPADAGPVVFFAGTDNYYQVVEIKLTWDEARDAAAAQTYLGRTGRLATITSDAENNFVIDHVIPNLSDGDSYWLGGLQPPGSDEPAGGWRWITDEPFVYSKWRPSTDEPNNSFDTGEDRIELFNRIQDGTWNDLWHDDSALSEGYVIEYAATSDGGGGTVPLPPALPAGMLLLPLATAARWRSSSATR